MTPHIMQAGKLAKAIKAAVPEAIILLGGAHISSVPEETMLRFPDIDIGFIGEADYSLPELLDTVSKGNAASTVKGTISREHSQLINTGQREEKIKIRRSSSVRLGYSRGLSTYL